jgi:threonyl-tRNA synthetase
MISMQLKDGSQREYEEGMSLLEIARRISPKLAKSAVAAVLNGQVTDLLTVPRKADLGDY